MGRLRTETREAAWAACAGAIQSLGPVGTFLLLARWTTPDELGRYSLAIAIIVPVFLAARMQLRQAAVADPQGRDSFEAYRKLRGRAATTALAAICLSMLAVDVELAVIVWATALSRWTEELGDIHYAPMQRAGLWPRIAGSQLLRIAGSLGLLYVCWPLFGLPVALVGAALWQTAITVCIDSPRARRLEPGGPTESTMGQLLRLNWPLGCTAAVISMMAYVPRYALAWTGDEALVGDYAALAQVALLGNLVVQGAGQAALGRLGISFIRDRERFIQIVRELLVASLAIGFCGLLTAMFWGDELLVIIFQPRFGSMAAALAGMMVAALCVYVTSVFGYALTAAGVKRKQLAVFGMALGVGVMTSFPLSAAYGLIGAIGGNVCSWAAAALLSGMLLRDALTVSRSDDPSKVKSVAQRFDGSRAV